MVPTSSLSSTIHVRQCPPKVDNSFMSDNRTTRPARPPPSEPILSRVGADLTQQQQEDCRRLWEAQHRDDADLRSQATSYPSLSGSLLSSRKPVEPLTLKNIARIHHFRAVVHHASGNTNVRFYGPSENRVKHPTSRRFWTGRYHLQQQHHPAFA